jgi:hypothetical protein
MASGLGATLLADRPSHYYLGTLLGIPFFLFTPQFTYITSPMQFPFTFFLLIVASTAKGQQSSFRRLPKDDENTGGGGGGGGGGADQGTIFTMAECPGKCLSLDEKKEIIELDDCHSASGKKFWSIDYSCAGSDSFFKIKHSEGGCIADPEDCSICDKDIGLVNCDSHDAAWFSYGNLHKTSPKAYYLYSARCWLNEGKVSVLATPSLEAKTCPEDHSVGACERLEWNLDRFSSDVLYYEWSFNDVKETCDSSLF